MEIQEIAFLTLSLSFLFLLGIIIYFKEYRNTYPLYGLFLLLIFYSPAVYYICGGTSYRFFNEKSFVMYMFYSSAIFFINSCLLILKNTNAVKATKNNFLLRLKNEESNYLVTIYFASIALIVFGYIVLYFQQFPLIHFLFTGALLERPDVTGDIPHFYTMSTIMLFLFPSIYFFYFNKIKSVLLHLACVGTISFILTAGGHKGVITFFFIFLWYYGMNRRLDIKLVAIMILLLGAYAVTKGINTFDSDTAEYLLTSPFRRFFVTQGACMITRFHMLDVGFIFNPDIPIKNQVCEVMNGGFGFGCSAPTSFVGDLMVKYGFFLATSIYVVVLIALLWIIKNIDALYSDNIFIKWNLFCFLFLIGMAEITTESFLRILLICFNVYFVAFLSSVTKRKLNIFNFIFRK